MDPPPPRAAGSRRADIKGRGLVSMLGLEKRVLATPCTRLVKRSRAVCEGAYLTRIAHLPLANMLFVAVFITTPLIKNYFHSPTMQEHSYIQLHPVMRM